MDSERTEPNNFASSDSIPSVGGNATLQTQRRPRCGGANPVPAAPRRCKPSAGAFLVPRRQRWCVPIVARTVAVRQGLRRRTRFKIDRENLPQLRV
ncbi:hypothetical protein M569_14118 [Genlisea aurea]|uniref:Uncharacterized protein n=1 Tax=Genlisea aurea TaxID=192259 RepID=S8C1V5_9LAMI|nr:hypothetical protein M569_14118 [Genlisea aurea]